MGQFSWLDCVTGEQIIDNYPRKVYLLIPKEMGGGHIEEACYDGYGNFGNKDVYDLIADWNKGMIPEIQRKDSLGKWKCDMSSADKKVLQNFYEGKPLKEGITEEDGFCLGTEKRTVGIIMACYDEDNARLDFPIKITYDRNAVYEKCEPSPSDPNQGWPDYD